jgi:hypothetical protein
MMLQPAGRRSKRKRQPEEESGSFDPIALTLALWLGLVVGVSGFVRLAQDAAADAALMQAHQTVATHTPEEASPLNPKLMAFGG